MKLDETTREMFEASYQKHKHLEDREDICFEMMMDLGCSRHEAIDIIDNQA